MRGTFTIARSRVSQIPTETAPWIQQLYSTTILRYQDVVLSVRLYPYITSADVDLWRVLGVTLSVVLTSSTALAKDWVRILFDINTFTYTYTIVAICKYS